MRRRILAALALFLAPVASVFERWPAGAAFLFLAVILKAWPAFRKPKESTHV